jgi:murein DD-endopeptidase MepM/ murein hydrolase activator NlpD
MPEKSKAAKNPPTTEKQSETPPKPTQGGGLAESAGRIFNRVPPGLRRYGTIAVVLVVALLVVGVMRNFAAGMQQTRQEELRATAQALAMPTIEAATGGIAGALMPSFSQAASEFSEGVPRLASIDTIIPSRARVDIENYTVVQGDTLFGIADKFGLKPESILWFNFDTLEDNPNEIKPGQVLNIPPVDGVMVTYHTGENLEAIADNASYYDPVDAQDIIEWPGNELDPYETDVNNPNIPDGFQLIIPGGSRKLQDWGPPAVTRQNAATAAYYGPGACGAIYEGAIGNGTFVWPTVATYLSGFDFTPPTHNGIDIAGAEGNAVFAVDSGVVVYAGWSNSGYGNLLVIDHGTGWQSAYAHLNTYAVGCGQSVTQGEVIAAVGTTGNSSGPHLHFELNSSVYGKVNPWDWLIVP